MNICAELMQYFCMRWWKLVTFTGEWLQWLCKTKSSPKILGCEWSFRSFSLAGDRTDAERPIPNSHVQSHSSSSPFNKPGCCRNCNYLYRQYISESLLLEL